MPKPLLIASMALFAILVLLAPSKFVIFCVGIGTGVLLSRAISVCEIKAKVKKIFVDLKGRFK